MARRLKDWIASYAEFTKDTEPPKSYHTWVAISTIAAALQRRVYISRGHETIYPNQYIILVGPSGTARKGTAINIGKKLMQQVSIQLAAQRVTIEALIKAIEAGSSPFTDSTTGRWQLQCALTCISGELSTFLGQKNIDLLAMLTDWYDSLDEWRYETKWSGIFKINNMCFNLLGGTAPDWLPSILPLEAVGGGFTSRCIFVVEFDKLKTVADEPPVNEKLQDDLINDLESMMNMSGEMIWAGHEVANAFSDWYVREDKKLRAGTQYLIDPRFGGYNSRRATHLKKVCIALSASRGDDLIITMGDLKRGIKLLQITERKMSRVFTGLGKARFSEATEKILHVLMREHEVSRSELLRRYYRDIDTYTLDAVEEVLKQMKVMKVRPSQGLGDTIYIYVGDEKDGD